MQRRVGFTTQNGAQRKGEISKDKNDAMLIQIEKQKDKFLRSHQDKVRDKMLDDGKKARLECEKPDYIS